MKMRLPGFMLTLILSATAMPLAAQEFSEQALQQYATAQEDIRAITEDYRATVEAADAEVTAEERFSREHEYQRKLTNAVQDAGLTAEQYNSIQAEVMRDPALQRRVEDMM